MSEFPIEFSPSIASIAGALAAAQGEIIDAKKDAENPAFKREGKKTMYATLSSVRAAITPAFSKNGLAVAQYFEPHGLDGVMVITLLMHKSGEWIKSKLFLPTTKKDAQGMGSAITYGRRYALAAIANIASDEDDDANAATKPDVAKAAPPAQSDVDVSAMIKALETAADVDALAKAILGVGRVKDKLSKDDLAKCTAARENRVRELEAQEAAAQ